MKLEQVLNHLNSFEKNSFLKVINDIVSEGPENLSEIEKLLSSDSTRDLKAMDNINIAKVFALVEREFADHVAAEFANTSSQLDILTDIVIRDGNCIMKQDWFSMLYEAELRQLKKKIVSLKSEFESEKSQISENRKRDYRIYKACLTTAYTNDDEQNADRKVTPDEQSILNTLASELELSIEEIKLINYMIVPMEKLPIDTIINDLKNLGILFYSKKQNTVYISDEMVRVLRKVRGKEIADKFFRRVLKLIREPQLNLICKKHNIDWRQSYPQKVKEIINEGVSFSSILSTDMFREGTKVSERKKAINDLCEKGLQISPALKGVTLEDKIENLIQYFEDIERDEKVGISIEGYENLLINMGEALPKLNQMVKSEFELQDEYVLKSSFLLAFNIKPRDVLEILPKDDLEGFCSNAQIKTRGNLIQNILDAYKDSDNLYIENFESIGFRDLATLKENGIRIKESELGIKFEELTKTILTKLGFNVDEELRRSLNTKKDKIDIVINLENRDLILVECKTVKESGYNKFSSVYRQLKAYANLAKSKDYKVIKSLLIAPEFSDEFINDCELEYELNLSLITANSLLKILEGFKESNLSQLPYKLLLRDVLIQEERIIRAITK